jgi:glycerophosphoryl diester phosphodiesterase
MHPLLLAIMISASSFAFDWQGHRGARGLYPENTIGGMKEALKYPITTLELDVVVSKDKKIVVSHEPWMNPEICTHPKHKDFKKREFNLYQMDYEEILLFDCGSKEYERFPNQMKAVVGKPLLKTLIDEIELQLKELGRKVNYNIEIKSTLEDEKKRFQPDYKEMSDLVVKLLLEKLPPERFSLQSFDWRVLKYIHTKYPSIALVALQEEKERPGKVIERLGFEPEVYSPYFKNLNRQDLEYYHSKGIKVIPWTVNSVLEMEELLLLGVDGIITDYPNIIEKVLNKSCKTGQNLFEGKCISVPTHALPSSNSPGWVCKNGFMQKRNHCEKIKLPSHSRLLEDGKTWVCKEGYERYRSTCRKRK